MIYLLLLLKPLNIAEVLTVWQQIILREHAHTSLVSTSLIWHKLQFESIEITFFLHHLERTDCMNGYLINRSVVNRYKLKTDSIVQASLVDNLSTHVLMAGKRLAPWIIRV